MEPSDDYESATTSSSQQPIVQRLVTVHTGSLPSGMAEKSNNECIFNNAVDKVQNPEDYVDSVEYKPEIPKETSSALPYENVKSKCLSVSRKQDLDKSEDCDVYYDFALPFMTLQSVEKESIDSEEFFSADEIYHEPLFDAYSTINQIGESSSYDAKNNSATTRVPGKNMLGIVMNEFFV